MSETLDSLLYQLILRYLQGETHVEKEVGKAVGKVFYLYQLDSPMRLVKQLVKQNAIQGQVGKAVFLVIYQLPYTLLVSW